MRRCPCFGPSSSFCVAWFRASGEAPMAQNLPLARGWKRRVRSSVLHILALGTTACPHQLEPRARRSVAGINLLVSTPHNASFHASRILGPVHPLRWKWNPRTGGGAHGHFVQQTEPEGRGASPSQRTRPEGTGGLSGPTAGWSGKPSCNSAPMASRGATS